MGREEALRVPRGLASAHRPFPLAGRPVGIFRAVVEVSMLPVFDTREHLPPGGAIAGQPIRGDDPWPISQPLEKSADNCLAAPFGSVAKIASDLIHLFVWYGPEITGDLYGYPITPVQMAAF
jgi:hypothetical protein